MKWESIIETMENNVLETAKNAIMDIVVPLQNEGVQNLGINQLISLLQDNQDLSGVAVDVNLIQNAIDGLDGLSVSTDASGDLNLNIDTVDDVSPQKPTDASDAKKVNDAAVRSAKKDW